VSGTRQTDLARGEARPQALITHWCPVNREDRVITLCKSAVRTTIPIDLLEDGIMPRASATALIDNGSLQAVGGAISVERVPLQEN